MCIRDRRGAEAIRGRIDALRQEGVEIAIVDAISNDDLLALGPALKGMPLVTACLLYPSRCV